MKALKLICLVSLTLININILSAQEKITIATDPRITYITGEIGPTIKPDTLTLFLNGPFFYDRGPWKGASQTLTAIPTKTGKFCFKIRNENAAFHISLFLSSKKNIITGNLTGGANIDDYLIEPGDSIDVSFDRQEQRYSGRGAELFKAQYAVAQTDPGNNKLYSDTAGLFNNQKEKWLQREDSLLAVQLDMLANFQAKISPAAYSIIRADIIGYNRDWVYRDINFTGPFFVEGTPLTPELSKLCVALQDRPAYINQEDRAILSPKYVAYLYDKMRIEIKFNRVIHNQLPSSDVNYFPVIRTTYTGLIRDKLLTYWLIYTGGFNNLKPDYLDSALAVMQNPFYIKKVEDLKETISKGQPVLDFAFQDVKGKTVHLADFKGKVLLLDFWFTGCGGCIAVAEGLPNVEAALKDQNVLFISLSIDKDKKLWLKSIDQHQPAGHYRHYTTATTEYLYTGGTGQNNPFIQKYVPGGMYPYLLIIDKGGKIYSSTPARPITPQGQQDLIKELSDAENK